MAEEKRYLQNLLSVIKAGELPAEERMAVTWFKSIVSQSMIGLAKEVVPQQLKVDAAQKGYITGRLIVGRMYFFMYNPKHKATLPYYDMFPLVLPIQRESDGFLGINFHYLHPTDRAILMDEIKIFVNDRSLSDIARIKLKYDMLRGFTRFKRAKPAIKRYLTTYCKSQFIPVTPEEWAPAIFLPVEKFRKMNKQGVWSESKKIYSSIRQ
jgi:hypothetical protein